MGPVAHLEALAHNPFHLFTMRGGASVGHVVDIRRPNQPLLSIRTGAGFVAEDAGAVARTMASPPLSFDPRGATVTSFAEGQMRVMCLRTGACLFERTTTQHPQVESVFAARYAERNEELWAGGADQSAPHEGAQRRPGWWSARWWVGAPSGALGFVEGP